MTKILTILLIIGLSLIGVDVVAEDLVADNLNDLEAYCKAGDHTSCFVLETLRQALENVE